MTKAGYAVTATLFFLAFIAIVAVYGGTTSRYLVAIAAFIGAISQFVAQDDRGGLASVGLAYTSMGCGIAALVMWS